MASTSEEVSRSSVVSDDLQKAIAHGEWAVGDRFPTTRELASRFGVSLSTVQAALHELEVRGFIERRPRVGTFVRSRTPTRGDTRTRRPPRRRGEEVAMLWAGRRDDILQREDTWAHRIFQSVQDVLAEAGYHMVLVSDRVEDWQARVGRVEDDLAGVISFVNPAVRPVLERLDEREIPWVTISPLHEQCLHNFVGADNFSGGRIVGRCFARMGLERALVMGTSLSQVEQGAPPKTSMMQKMHGFLQGYLDESAPLRGIEYVSTGALSTEEVGYLHAARYVDEFGPPSGIFAAGGDLLALGAIRCLRERGIDVPDQVGVVGGTGLGWGEFTHPSLTALGQPMEPLGMAAAEMLLEMIREGHRRLVGRYIPCRMILRDSLRLTDDARALVEQELPEGAPAGTALQPVELSVV